jgi:hypothetical protein
LIFRRKDGTWSAELGYRDEYGTLKRRTVYGKRQAEVRAKFRDARERIDSGAPVEDASMTVAVWLEDWITKSLAASDRKQATKDLYATLACSHLVPAVGTIPLGRLRPSDVEALVVAKRDAACRGRRSGRSTPSCGRRWTSPRATDSAEPRWSPVCGPSPRTGLSVRGFHPSGR